MDPHDFRDFDGASRASISSLSDDHDNDFTRVFDENQFVGAAAGWKFILTLTDDGSIYAYGKNDEGQLGQGYVDDDFHFLQTKIDVPDQVIGMAAGRSHGLALTKNGQVYGFGSNDLGELGLGCQSTCQKPTLIQELDQIGGIAGVSTDADTSFVLTDDGRIYAFGLNQEWRICDGDAIINQPTLILCDVGNTEIIGIAFTASHNLALTYDGDVYTFGRETPKLIYYPEPICRISAGFDHCMSLTENGHIYSFGDNEFGQLGLELNTKKVSIDNPVLISDPIQESQICGIASGRHHNLILTDNGSVYAYGLNYSGIISQRNKIEKLFSEMSDTQFVGIAAGFNHSLALTTNGHIFSLG